MLLFFIHSDVSNLVNIGLVGREEDEIGGILDEGEKEFGSAAIVLVNAFWLCFAEMLAISTVITAVDPVMNDMSLYNILITLAQAHLGQC